MKKFALLWSLLSPVASSWAAETQSRPFVVADASQPTAGLLYVAEREGFFRDEGIAVELRSFETGRGSMQALTEGRADAAVAAETPIVSARARGSDIVILAAIGSSSRSFGIVARRSSGIHALGELPGHSVGITSGTSSEFFLDRYLIFSGISPQRVGRINLDPGALIQALQEGRIPAAVLWQPQRQWTEDRLGPEAISFAPDKVFTWTFSLATTRLRLASGRRPFVQLLKALARADQLCRVEPLQCSRDIRAHFNLSEAEMDSMSRGYDLELSLDQGLLFSLEDQIRWQRSRGESVPPSLANVLNLVDSGPLREAHPQAVHLIEPERRR